MVEWQGPWRGEGPPRGACWAPTPDNHWPHGAGHHPQHAARPLPLIAHLHHTQTLRPLRLPLQPWETTAPPTPNGRHLWLLQEGERCLRGIVERWSIWIKYIQMQSLKQLMKTESFKMSEMQLNTTYLLLNPVSKSWNLVLPVLFGEKMTNQRKIFCCFF